ncbi:MAG TPA: cellulase family glycosylhydrolase [Chryseolinea sp.]|nr:cellulase family glycosylhydrolase [Chryseolinea sp.]
MKYNFLFSLTIIVSVLSCSPKKEAVTPDEPKDTLKFTIHRGTNIAHWLSQSERRGTERATFFTRKDILFIDSVGFDHIRLPVDEEQLWDEQGQRHEDAFELLNNCLTWCSEAGLKVVLDLHILRSHHFNAAEKPLWTKPEEQDKFIRLWRDLAGAVRKWPNEMVAYEFMNEPVADEAVQWNHLLARVADSIRSWEPSRVLVIGSNRWQSANTFDQLEIPPDDNNILLSFHFYEPFHLTHYQASWTKLKDFKGKVNYPGQIVEGGKTDEEKRTYNRDTLERMMEKPFALAAKLNLPLYCGEFGVIDGSPEQAKLAWYKDMVAIFEKHGVAYANWNFKSGSFGIVDENLKPDTTMIKILTKKSE